MKEDYHVLICLGATFFVLAAAFACFGGPIYAGQKEDRESYWKSSCNVIACSPYDPSYDVVTVETHEHFDLQESITVKHGCRKYPLGITIVCYVNAGGLKIEQPGGVTGLVLVIISGIFAAICFLFILACVGCCVWFGVHKMPDAPSTISPSSHSDSSSPSSSASFTSSSSSSSSEEFGVKEDDQKFSLYSPCVPQ